MALSQKHRSSLYRSLTPVVGEEEAEALLSQFPANDLDVPATKDFVRAELSGLEARLTERMREMTIWFAGSLVGAVVAGMGVAVGIASLV
jgi:hypothetical protein